MKICVVHNAYGKFSGEEAVVESMVSLLETNGHQVVPFFRSSEEIVRMPLGRLRAFLSGIYSPGSRKAMARFLREQAPDIVHIHNLFPLISPAILPICRQYKIPVVMTVHNYRLVCPSGLHLYNGEICKKCREGREYWCFLKNCEGDYFKSVGYAIRNLVARWAGFYKRNVNLFLSLTAFQKECLVAEGFPWERIHVLPNMLQKSNARPSQTESARFVGYVGRISREKGIETLLSAAAGLPHVPFETAGDYSRVVGLKERAPHNITFHGHLNRTALSEFYNACRIIVLCSVCYEGFPIVLAEAMQFGKPVICSRIGGLPEIVDDGVTGLLFEPGNESDLREKIDWLWKRPAVCRRMGEAGRKKAFREYSEERYYERLISFYHRTIGMGQSG